jgi:hypothetical protein
MSLLSREDILKADDLDTRDVDVPEWGGMVRVRELSGTARDEYDASKLQRQADGSFDVNLANQRAKLAARCIVGDDGEPLFNELDIGRLGQKSAAALERVCQVAAELSGLGEQAEDDAGKDSAPPPNDETGSTSPDS